ncbi:hypothetical protein BdWA1_001447 [Babesia duncani]|uniref:Uncharacterized protein n=1 Tax=Babesia duncani TaxID=323732 RepID=A0AAD9UQZ4_9APIC|nr:hypothetical protein BdWA1_001447 [Babesia duncani]
MPNDSNSIGEEKNVRRCSSRKRKKPLRYSSSSVERQYEYQDFDAESESLAWDNFYTNGKNSDVPFSGFDMHATVSIIEAALKTVRGKPLNQRDVIIEIGHGKHPLIYALPNVKYYFGIEFSAAAVFESIKLHKNSPSYDFGPNVEFLLAKEMNYFTQDSVLNLDLILPQRGNTRLKSACANILVAKSTLDYITCRLSQSVNLANWEEHPRIPPFIVEMFDSISQLTLPQKRGALIIFVEPDDDIKFKDHIVTLVRVLYAATFKGNSPAKYIRLKKIIRHANVGAICYVLEKGDPYASFMDMRAAFWGKCRGLYSIMSRQDHDWLLPTRVPPKWDSDAKEDIECIDILDLN